MVKYLRSNCAVSRGGFNSQEQDISIGVGSYSM